MRRILTFILLFAFVMVTGALCEAQLSISELVTPYAPLQQSVKIAGTSYGTGAVAYGPVGTPLTIYGTNFVSNPTVTFPGPSAGTVLQVEVSSFTPTSFIVNVPGQATTGNVFVTVGGVSSNSLPFVVVNGRYSASCPVGPPAGQLTVSTSSLGAATVDAAYSATLQAVGGQGTYAWSVVSGSLPSALSLNSNTGTVSGTPASAGSSEFVAAVSDTEPSTVAAMIAVSVNKASPTVSLTSSLNLSTYGGSVTFTATVTPATPTAPTGTVTFMNGSTVFGTATLTNGTATLSNVTATTAHAFGTGANTITAFYGGDSNFNTATSAGFTQTVNRVLIEPGIINTVAGNGAIGYPFYSGDDGMAMDAQMWGPSDIAVDSAGNIYIADSGNNRVRLVTAATGEISTVAGNGTEGYFGDGGPATNASLYHPFAVVVDAFGNIYIGALDDSGSPLIRKVTASTGNISTVPNTSGGGCAAVDTSGNLYFCDSNYHIRELTVSGNNSIVAGNGTAGYSGEGILATNSMISPAAVAVDSSNNIYILSVYPANLGSRVQIVSASTGKMSTVAGNGSEGYSGDGGPATTASLNMPGGIAVDASKNLYIADRSNERIREVTASNGYISTVAGNGTAGYSGDGEPATSAEIAGPSGVVVDSSGDLYIADTGNARIRVVGGHMITPTISMSASQTSVPYGTAVTFTAMLPAATTGRVTFFNGGPLGSPVTVSNGTATYTTTALPGGSNMITASYSGDTNYNPSTSAAVTVTVTTVALTTSDASVGYGTPLTFTAMVPLLATGTVTFFDGGTTLGTGTVSSGLATLTISSLILGSHTIAASYSGNGIYSAATSGSLTQTVTPSSQEITTTTLPSGIQNWSYTATLQATGGLAPYSWSVSSGSLPAGLTLGANSGTLYGLPTTIGSSGFTVQVTDANQNKVSASLSIVINPAEAPLQITSLSPSSGFPGTIVTLIGSNFGITQENNSSVLFNGSAVPVLQWSNSAIVFAVPSGVEAGSAQVTVTVAGNNSSATFTVPGAAVCTVN